MPSALQGGQHRHLDDVDAERLAGRGRARAAPSATLRGDVLGDARRPGGRRRAGWRSAGPWPARVAVAATGCRAGGGGRPSRSPTAPARRRGAAARSGSSCPSPRCRCGSRSCSGCWRSRSVSSAPRSERSSSALSRASRSRAQPVEVDPLLPVDGVGSVRADRHRSPASRCAGTSSKPSAPERCQVALHMTYVWTSMTSFLSLTRVSQVYSPIARQRRVRGLR